MTKDHRTQDELNRPWCLNENDPCEVVLQDGTHVIRASTPELAEHIVQIQALARQVQPSERETVAKLQVTEASKRLARYFHADAEVQSIIYAFTYAGLQHQLNQEQYRYLAWHGGSIEALGLATSMQSKLIKIDVELPVIGEEDD